MIAFCDANFREVLTINKYPTYTYMPGKESPNKMQNQKNFIRLCNQLETKKLKSLTIPF